MNTVHRGSSQTQDWLAVSEGGEIRRLTMLFADLVGSTSLSARVEPETYRTVVGRYRQLVQTVVNDMQGHIGSTKGDGLLAVFGHPAAHEDDVRRAVAAGLRIVDEVAKLSEQSKRRFGFGIEVRVGVHRGPVYLDTPDDDVFGCEPAFTQLVSGLAEPTTVVVSDAVSRLIGDSFELQSRRAATVPGVDGPIGHHRVLAHRTAPCRAGTGPLVGRHRERTQLVDSWARLQAAESTSVAVVFRGEPGIGKSRLAAAAAELAERSGAPVLSLQGSTLHAGAALHPVRALLERRCQSTADEPDRLAVEVAKDCLLAYLGAGPALVIAEDAQWFDASTSKVLGALMATAGRRLLVVITGRPGGWLPPDWPVDVHELQPLTDAESDELITALRPGISASQRALVRARCDGVPLHIEQLLAGMTGDEPDHSVPDALYELLVARLGVSSVVLRVVQSAAVIGRHVDRSLLRSAVDVSDSDFAAAIHELVEGDVLCPWGADGWRFRRELVREVAAELVPPSLRRELHARLADAIYSSAEVPDHPGVVESPGLRRLSA